MTSFKFHLRPFRGVREGEGKLYLRVIHKRKSGSITLPYSLREEEWSSSLGQVLIPLVKNTRSVYLHKVATFLEEERKVLTKLVQSLEKKEPFTIQDILSCYKKMYVKGHISLLVTELSNELIAEGRYRTARAYRCAWQRLVGFSGNEHLSAKEFTPSLIIAFEKYLREENKSLNTISFYMRNLRAIYNKGIKKGYIESYNVNPFEGVYTRVASTRRQALSKEEMIRLDNLLESNRLPQKEKESLALFLFAFHARGMCFVDLAHLRKSNVGDRIGYYRKKTGQYIEVKVTSKMRTCMDVFKKLENDFVFPVIHSHNSYLDYCSGLKKQNFLLKRIAKKAGIKKPLTTHIARHSWATIARGENIPIGIISEALGHTSLETTYRYLDSFGKSALDRAGAKVSRATSSLQSA